MGFMTLPPRIIGKRKTAAIHFSTMFTNERNMTMERMFSKAFQALAFFIGLPSQTDLMTSTHRTSMAIVIAVNMSNYNRRKKLGILIKQSSEGSGVFQILRIKNMPTFSGILILTVLAVLLISYPCLVPKFLIM